MANVLAGPGEVCGGPPRRGTLQASREMSSMHIFHKIYVSPSSPENYYYYYYYYCYYYYYYHYYYHYYLLLRTTVTRDGGCSASITGCNSTARCGLSDASQRKGRKSAVGSSASPDGRAANSPQRRLSTKGRLLYAALSGAFS